MTRLLVLVLVLSFNFCHAQFQWGIRTGYQASTLENFSSSEGESLPWRSKYLVPAFYFQWSLPNSFSLSTELSYTSKGGRSDGLSSNPYAGDQVMPYLTVPVLVHYNLNRVSFFAGGEVGYKFKSTFKNGASRTEHMWLTHPIDVGVTGGAGYRLTDDYTVSFRYTHGLINLMGKEVTYPSIDGSRYYPRENGQGARNRSFQLTLSTAFRYNTAAERKRKVSFDFRQGMGSYSLFTIDDNGFSTFESDKKVTYEAALEMNVGIKKYFQFKTGVNYIRKTNETAERVDIKYLSVPLLFGVSPIITDDFRLSVQGGLGVNFMVSENNGFKEYFGDADETNAIHTSFIYGVEGQIPLKKKLSLLLVYRNNWDNDGAFRMNYSDLKFRGYSASVGLRYHLGNPDDDQPPTPEKEIPEGTGSRFGLKAGLNFHWLSSNTIPEYLKINHNTAVPNWHGGVFYNIRLGNRFSLVPEITYTKRAKSLPSFDLPVVLSQKVGKKFLVEAGPQMIFFFKKPELETSGAPYKLYVSKLTDFGVTAGARYQVFRNIEFSARYFHGLTDTAGLMTSDGQSVSFEGFNRTVMISSYFTLAGK